VTSMADSGQHAARPLAGVRVTDFTGYASGPYCTLMLALLGAEIIRIESRARLDIQRRPHPVYGRLDVPTFDYLAGHKRSVTLNLKRAEAASLARDIVAASDLVVENFRPGVMDRLGLGWDLIHARNPATAMVSISAYGQAGPDTERPGYAPIFAAEGGLSQMTGYPDGPPAEVRNQMDHEVGAIGAFVSLALLEEREITGAGRRADISAQAVAAMLVGESFLYAQDAGAARRVGNNHETWCPHGVYPALGDDRWIAIAVRSDEEWAAIQRFTGLRELQDPRFLTAAGRREARDVIDRALEDWMAKFENSALAASLQAAGVCAEVTLSAADLLADEHLRARGTLVELKHPHYGSRVAVDAPWRLLGSGPTYRKWSPELGQDNEYVLCGLLGHPQAQLASWIEDGTVY
jgi:crotonobetainyl-CoA:carnitine CoA-transferase CaiB-like acyl-CoA transferase